MSEPTALDWLAERGPRGQEEGRAAAHALILHREQAEDLQRLDELTPFERALADRAATVAARAVTVAVEAVIGRAAETVSASVLREALARSLPDLDFQPPRQPLPFGFMTPDRLRAAEVVRGAARAVEYETARERERSGSAPGADHA